MRELCTTLTWLAVAVPWWTGSFPVVVYSLSRNKCRLHVIGRRIAAYAHPLGREAEPGGSDAFELAQMMMTTVLVAAALTAASAGAPTPGKLSPDVSKEMMAAIVSTNKALGLAKGSPRRR